MAWNENGPVWIGYILCCFSKNLWFINWATSNQVRYDSFAPRWQSSHCLEGHSSIYCREIHWHVSALSFQAIKTAICDQPVSSFHPPVITCLCLQLQHLHIVAHIHFQCLHHDIASALDCFIIGSLKNIHKLHKEGLPGFWTQDQLVVRQHAAGPEPQYLYVNVDADFFLYTAHTSPTTCPSMFCTLVNFAPSLFCLPLHLLLCSKLTQLSPALTFYKHE